MNFFLLTGGGEDSGHLFITDRLRGYILCPSYIFCVRMNFQVYLKTKGL